MKLTQEQREVLEHMVVDADSWWQNALDSCIAKNGEVAGTAIAEQFLKNKVARHRDAYMAAVENEGQSYKNRAERENQ